MVEMSRRFVSLLGVMFFLAFTAGSLVAQEKPPVTPHDIEGKENCMMCHAVGVMPPVPDAPASHEGRGNETCQWCHAPTSGMQTTGATKIPHDLEGKDNCMMCHAAGVMPPVPDAPASHEGRGTETCLWCHTKATLQ